MAITVLFISTCVAPQQIGYI